MVVINHQNIPRGPRCAQWIRTQFLSQANQWSTRFKSSFYRWQATRVTEPISQACDQYVQYLLMGANLSVLNWHRQGLQPWRRRLFTYHSLTFPTDSLPFPPTGPARSPVYPTSINKTRVWVLKGPMTVTWSSNHSAIYRGLQLCLAITIELSLAIRSTRVDWKLRPMQLRHQFNSYNLLHKQES
jgi:hypothetical protein